MKAQTLRSIALLTAAAAATLANPSFLGRRDGTSTCSDLTIGSNNGDRKVAIVIDASLSMQENDPNYYRIAAARALNSFLLPASSSNPDQVAVISFAGSPNLLYPLGDPAKADSSISSIGNDESGTVIYEGVDMGIMQVNSTASTAHRSAVIVFTDGEDSYTTELVDSLTSAAQQGIRVSFGYLSNGIGTQDPTILTAIRATRGIYASIIDSSGSQNFINYALLNGLTDNDNPQGYDNRLLPGLGQTYTISNSDSVNLLYHARSGENFNFTITSISAGYGLNATAFLGGSALNSTDSDGFLQATAPGDGDVTLTVTALDSPENGLFVVTTNSDVPLNNCTVGVSSGGATLTAGVKAGIAIGSIAGAGAVAVLGFFAFKAIASGGAATAGSGAASAQPVHPITGIEKLTAQTNITSMGQSGVQPLHGPAGVSNGHALPPSSIAPTHGPGFNPHIGPSGPPGTGGAENTLTSLHSGLPSTGTGSVSVPGGASIGPAGSYAPFSATGAGAASGGAGIGSGGVSAASGMAYVAPLVVAGPLALAGSAPTPSGPGYSTGGASTPQQQPPPYQQPLSNMPNSQQPLSNMPNSQQPLFNMPSSQQPLSHMPPNSQLTGGPHSTTTNPMSSGQPTGGAGGVQAPWPAPAPAPPQPNGLAPMVVLPITGRREREKHHHHEWMTLQEACEDPQCMLNDPAHWCEDPNHCPCTCRVEGCPSSR